MKFTQLFIILLWGTNIALAQNSNDVVVLPMQMSAPEGAEKMGSVTDGNNATKTNCDYEGLIADIKEKARAMQGNLVKITQLVSPSFIGKCYKIKADVYSVKDLSKYKPAEHKEEPAAATNKNYATLYLYRLRDTLALITNYHVHLDGDSVIYTARKKSKDSVRLYKEGPTILWGDIEHRTELKINVKFGEQYYVRCGLEKREIRMNPVLELVDKTLGESEYSKINTGKKNTDVSYLKQIH